nr:hypothetical protein [uncultured archaeon]AQS33716.1 hypothetical protein [uncultured archaeon]
MIPLVFILDLLNRLIGDNDIDSKMKHYRFSPIEDEKHLLDAVRYVVEHASDLCDKTIGMRLPISSLTIFAHYSDEYDKLIKIVKKLGKPFNENNGPRIELSKPIKLSGNIIRHIRIRIPDPYRMQVGCCDFDVKSYDPFKKKYLKCKNLRVIKRPEYEMIEFFDPDYDVLAYIVSN